MEALGWRVIDVVLQNGGVHHGEGGKHEAEEDAASRVEIDLVLAKRRVYDD